MSIVENTVHVHETGGGLFPSAVVSMLLHNRLGMSNNVRGFVAFFKHR